MSRFTICIRPSGPSAISRRSPLAGARHRCSLDATLFVACSLPLPFLFDLAATRNVLRGLPAEVADYAPPVAPGVGPFERHAVSGVGFERDFLFVLVIDLLKLRVDFTARQL